MASVNMVFLAGNLTKDPELRRIPNGTAVADLRVAVNEAYKDKDGKTVKRTCFVDVVAWDSLAEECSETLTKGAPVLVEGRLQLDAWKTKEGANRSRLRVRAVNIQFIGRRKGGGEAAEDANPPPNGRDTENTEEISAPEEEAPPPPL